MPGFVRIQQILDGVIIGWAAKNNGAPDLMTHNINFGWATKEQLLAGAAFGKALIRQKDMDDKAGAQSNIVLALTKGVPGYPAMPLGGPYLPPEQIQEIVDWINSGCPD